MNNYSSIITNGLGGSAQCLIVAKFGLSYTFSIEIIDPPPPIISSGGGGGSGRGFAVPNLTTRENKLVVVAVKFSVDKTWKRTYNISNKKVKYIIKITNFVSYAKTKISIGIDQISSLTKKVIAKFNMDNK